MSERLSGGLVNRRVRERAKVTAVLDGTGVVFTTANGSIAVATIGTVFAVGDAITIENAGVNTGKTVLVSSIISSGEVYTGAVREGTDVIATETIDSILMASKGGSMLDIFRNGTMWVYDSDQTASADTAITGSVLLKVTLNSGAFATGAAANGINLNLLDGTGVLKKAAAEVWSGMALASGTAKSFRFFANDADPLTVDSEDCWFDGAIATSGSELDMSNTNITAGNTTSINTFSYTLPQV